MESCIFCRIVAGKVPAEVIYRDEGAVAFLDLAPISLGHTLVVPKQHSEVLHQADPGVLAQLMAAVQLIAPRLQLAVGAEAYNIGINCGQAAGQAVPHTHVHIIPRHAGDGLRHWPGQETTPAQLHEAAERIRASFASY